MREIKKKKRDTKVQAESMTQVSDGLEWDSLPAYNEAPDWVTSSPGTIRRGGGWIDSSS